MFVSCYNHLGLIMVHVRKLYLEIVFWPLPFDKGQSNTTQVHGTLQKALAQISSLVKDRGGEYDYLDPENVACSIDN